MTFFSWLNSSVFGVMQWIIWIVLIYCAFRYYQIFKGRNTGGGQE